MQGAQRRFGRGLSDTNCRAQSPDHQRYALIYLTKVTTMSDEQTTASAVGAPAIQITPAMIDAGVPTLMSSGRVSENLPDWVARSIVEDILRAALGRIDFQGIRARP